MALFRSFATACIVFLAIGSACPTARAGDDKSSPGSHMAVVEYVNRQIRWENDGTGRERAEGRILIKNEVGRNVFGQFSNPYQAATEDLQLEFVRVVKPDGSTVDTPLENVMELSGTPMQEYPIYTDLMYKVVPVSGLQVGDRLEYAMTRHFQPLVPGHFFSILYPYVGLPVNKDTVQLDLPAKRAVQINTYGREPDLTETRHGRLIRTWNLASEETKTEVPDPLVAVSTFESWEDVGNWYHGLSEPATVPSPEIVRLARQLTEGAATQHERIDRIYQFVAQSIRYVGISFGLGAYRPHEAKTTQGNEYGDCKDKHVLLASLLKAIGITAYPVLVNSQGRVDDTVPSPLQFDHLMSVVDLGKQWLWMDTTLGLAPLGVLPVPIRGQKALIVRRSRSVLETIPDRGFVKDRRELSLEGSIDFVGDMTARVTQASSGWFEVGERLLFQNLSADQVAEYLMAERFGTGMFGDVSAVAHGDPTNVSTSFEYSHDLDVEFLIDPLESVVSVTLPWLFFGDLDYGLQDSGYEQGPSSPDVLMLGGPFEMIETLKLELPVGMTVSIPEKFELDTPFASYRSSFRQNQQVLHVQRYLEFKRHAIDPERKNELREFSSSVTKNVKQKVIFRRDRVVDLGSIADRLDAESLTWAALDHGRAGRVEKASELAELAAKKNPTTAESWNIIASARLSRAQGDSAREAIQRALEIDPNNEFALRLMQQFTQSSGSLEDRMKSAQRLAEASPGNAVAIVQVGIMHAEAGRLDEAEASYRQALVLAPDNGEIHVHLGDILLRQEHREAAWQSFDRALELNRGPWIYNNIAWALAEADVDLDRAYKYASSAVERTRAEVELLDSLNGWSKSLQMQSQLSTYLDTLAWVEFRRGRFAEALQASKAAYRLEPNEIIARHASHAAAELEEFDVALHYYGLESMAAKTEPFGREDALPFAPQLEAHLSKRFSGPGAMKNYLATTAPSLLKDSGNSLSVETELAQPEQEIGAGKVEFVMIAILVDGEGHQLDRVVANGRDPWAAAALADAAKLKLSPCRIGGKPLTNIYPVAFGYADGQKPTVSRVRNPGAQ